MKIMTGKPFPLGVVIEERKVNFSVDAGSAETCSLLLYKKNEKDVYQEIPMHPTALAENIFCVMLAEAEVKNLEYQFQIDGKVILDPYVRVVSGKEGWLGEDETSPMVRGRLLRGQFAWEEDAPVRIKESDVIAYSIHMRGFTKNRMSKVKKKGTFQGLAEKVSYLKELGVNQVQCMPIYDFEEWLKPDKEYLARSSKKDWKVNYWGYGDAYCFAPKPAYAATKDPVFELKNLIKTLHREGIEFVVHFPFPDGFLPQEMVACLRYWYMEYHLDGFVINPFKLPYEMVAEDPVLKNCKVYVQDEKFQNTARRFAKGDEGVLGEFREVFRRYADGHSLNAVTMHSGFTLNDLYSYENKHNEANGENNRDGCNYNYSWNCGVEGETKKGAVLTQRRNQMKNIMAMLMLSQGAPCILAGDEFLNSQKGNNNVYCQDNPVGWLDWNQAEKNKWMTEYVQDLIAFRKKHPILHSDYQLEGNDPKRYGIPDLSFHGEAVWQLLDDGKRQMGVLLGGRYQNDEDLYLIFNMHWNEHEFALPALKKGRCWKKVFTTADGFLKTETVRQKEKTVTVAERSIYIFESCEAEAEPKPTAEGKGNGKK